MKTGSQESSQTFKMIKGLEQGIYHRKLIIYGQPLLQEWQPKNIKVRAGKEPSGEIIILEPLLKHYHWRERKVLGKAFSLQQTGNS